MTAKGLVKHAPQTFPFPLAQRLETPSLKPSFGLFLCHEVSSSLKPSFGLFHCHEVSSSLKPSLGLFHCHEVSSSLKPSFSLFLWPEVSSSLPIEAIKHSWGARQVISKHHFITQDNQNHGEGRKPLPLVVQEWLTKLDIIALCSGKAWDMILSALCKKGSGTVFA